MNADLNEIVSDEIIRKEYYKYDLPEDIKEDLEIFLCKRNEYFARKDFNSWVELKRAFDDIYHDTKYAYHIQIMPESDFFRLVNLLRKGVEYVE